MEGMKRLAPLVAALLLCAGPARAADAAVAAPDAPAGTPEPVVEVLTVEDEGARIDELRVRGEPQRVTVRTKGPIKSQYEIAVPRRGGNGAVAGQRVWHVLSF
jgi:hypothetical protein